MYTHIRTRALVFGESDDADDQVLIVCLHIECEDCGEYTVILPGHHVRGVMRALQRIAGMKPELTPEGETFEAPIHVHNPRMN